MGPTRLDKSVWWSGVIGLVTSAQLLSVPPGWFISTAWLAAAADAAGGAVSR